METTIRAVFNVEMNCFHIGTIRHDEEIRQELVFHSTVLESFSNYAEAEAWIMGELIQDTKDGETYSYSIHKEYTNRQFDDPATDAAAHDVTLGNDE